MPDYSDTVPVQPQAAEATTEIGADQQGRRRGVLWGVLVVLMGWPAVAALVGIALLIARYWPADWPMAWPLG